MNKVSIVYFSNTDVTATLAKTFSDALSKHKIETFIYSIKGSDIIEGRFKNTQIFDELHNSDAIVFASPTYMGGVAAQFKAFADASSDFWSEQKWAGKYAAGITCGSAPNGDQSNTLQYFFTLASQHGMFWLGLDTPHNNKDLSLNRLGIQLGVSALSVNGTTDEADLNTVKHLAYRIIKILKPQRTNQNF